MIRVNVFQAVKAEDRTACVKVAKELVEKSLKENGCVAYDVFESATRDNVLMICETWKDEAALAAHEKSAHFVSLIPQLEAFGAMKIEKFNF